MSQKKEDSYSKIKSLVEESIEKGIIEKDNLLDPTLFWYHTFHYISDPLNTINNETKFSKDNLEFFINREAEMKIISKYIGNLHNLSSMTHIALIGALGCGKHTTFKAICKIVNDSFPDIKYEFYNYYGFDFKNNIDLEDDILKKVDDSDLDMRIISCSALTKDFLKKRFKKYNKNTKILFSIWNIGEYSIRSEILVNKEIFFRNYSKKEIIKILRKRIEMYLIKDITLEKYKNNIIEQVLPLLSEISEGNLRISFILFRIIHQEARIKGIQLFNMDFPQTILEEFKNMKSVKLTDKENTIIKYMLFNGIKYITTSKMVQELNYERTVAWKYLENLTNKNVLYKQYGNPSKYEITELFLSIYEEKIKKKLIFKEH